MFSYGKRSISSLIMVFALIFCISLQNLSAIETEGNVDHDGSEGANVSSISGKVVGLNGMFTYSYPIQSPAGVNGVQPAISLSYASSSSGGLLGVGWNLSGLGAITRRGEWGGVPRYDSTDVFYFNGQKLIKETSGWIYHTEREGYARIEASGDPSTGTSTYWTVKSKDGTTYCFGYDDANCYSRINTVGLSTNHTRTWR